MQIPLRELKSELKNSTEECKKKGAYDQPVISKSILGLFSKLINKFENMKSYEAGLFVKSLDNWLERKQSNNEPKDKSSVEIGNIYMVDWNINYDPELPYEHPGVVIEFIDDMVWVIPVSGQDLFLKIAYHPDDNVSGDRSYRKVKIDDGFNKDSVMFLNQVKVISKSRLLYTMGKVDIESVDGLFKETKEFLIQKFFPLEYTTFLERETEYLHRIEYLSIQRKCNQSRADRYRNENDMLKIEIEELKKQLTNI